MNIKYIENNNSYWQRQVYKKSSFNKKLCETLISANILLNKLENPKSKKCLEFYTKNDIPSESTFQIQIPGYGHW